MLSENIDDVDFLSPILVVPLPDGTYRIIDGEHRFEAMQLSGATEIPCILADPERLDELAQKFQTIRMNKIRGHLNKSKFVDLVEDVIKEAELGSEEIAHKMGFVDFDEFSTLCEAARESLPDGAKGEFDKAKDEIKTVDDLNILLNRLFAKYGDSLPYNFMILEFGGKHHIWVRMPVSEYKRVSNMSREIMSKGFTFDSVLSRMLSLLNIDDFLKTHSDLLENIGAPDEKEIS